MFVLNASIYKLPIRAHRYSEFKHFLIIHVFCIHKIYTQQTLTGFFTLKQYISSLNLIIY